MASSSSNASQHVYQIHHSGRAKPIDIDDTKLASDDAALFTRSEWDFVTKSVRQFNDLIFIKATRTEFETLVRDLNNDMVSPRVSLKVIVEKNPLHVFSKQQFRIVLTLNALKDPICTPPQPQQPQSPRLTSINRHNLQQTGSPLNSSSVTSVDSDSQPFRPRQGRVPSNSARPSSPITSSRHSLSTARHSSVPVKALRTVSSDQDTSVVELSRYDRIDPRSVPSVYSNVITTDEGTPYVIYVL